MGKKPIIFVKTCKIKARTGKNLEKGFIPLAMLLIVAALGGVVVGGNTLVANILGDAENIKLGVSVERALRESPSFLDEARLNGASLEGDLVGTVLLPDGTFSAYRVVDAEVIASQGGATSFVGEAKLEFLSGDFAVGNFVGSKITPFFLKDGSQTEGVVFDRLSASLRLIDGQVIPIKILQGKVRGGKIIGGFEAQTYTSGHLIRAVLDDFGKLVAVAVSLGSNKATEAQTAITKQALGLFGKLAKETSTVVLGITQAREDVLGLEAAAEEDPFAPSFDDKKGTWTYGTVVPTQIATQVVPAVLKEIKSDSARLKIVTKGEVVTLSLDLAGITADISKDSVKSEHIKNGEVKGEDIAGGVIDTGHLASNLTFSNGDFLDLSRITHSSTSQMGLLLPNASSSSPSSPSTGEGYIAWDTSGNQIITYNGSSWTTVSGGGSGDITGVTAGSGLTGGGDSGAVTLTIGAGTGITVNADDIAINQAFTPTWTGAHIFSSTVTFPGTTYVNASGNVGVGSSGIGTARLSVLGGNVGIGTTTPDYPLHVIGNVGVGGSLTLSDPLRIVDYTSCTALETDSSGNLACGSDAGGISGGAVNGVAFWTASDTLSNSVANFYWDSTNFRLGIGTSSPDYTFRTQGTGFFSGFVGIGSSLNVTGNVGVGSSLSVTSAAALSTLNVTGISNLVGNVGIGTSLNVTSASVLDSLQVTKSISGATLGVSGISTLTGNVGIGSSLTVTGLTFSQGGLRVNGFSDLTGNVGIGTSLNVTSNTNLNAGLTVSAASIFNGTLDANGIFFLGDGGDIGSIDTSDWDISSTGDLTGIGAITADGTLTFSGVALDITTSSNQDLTLIPNGTGNVGIGTSNIGGRLIVLGQAGVGTGNVGIGFTTPTANLHILNTGTNNSLRIDDVLEDTTPLIVDSSGNLGIGATTAAYLLDVWGTGRLTSTLTVGGNVGVGLSLTVDSAAALNTLNVTGVSNLVGNVGVGTSLNVTSASILDSLQVTKSISGATLGVSGISTLTGNVGIGASLTVTGLNFSSGGLRVNGYSDLTGNVGVGSSLTVTSASVLDSLQVTKSISGATLGISGISTLTGNVGIGSSLTVTGLTFASGGLRVNGFSDLTGNVGVGGSLTVSSAAVFSTLGSGVVQSNSLGGISSGPVNLGSSTFVSGILPIANGGTNAAQFTSGGAIFYDGTRLAQQTSQFYWDNSNFRLGIGTSSPDYTFRTQGTGFFSGFVGIGSSLNVTGNVGIGASLSVTSASVLDSLQVTKSISGATLGISGISTLTGNVGIGSSLTVTGLTFSSGGLRVNGYSDLTGNVGVGTSLNVTSASVLDSLQVTKSISGATLGISGISTLTGNVGVGASLTVSSTGAFRLSGQTNCTNLTNGGKLTTDSSGNVYCAADISGGGSSAWSALTDPTANLTLAMAANTSTFNFTTTGSSNMFSLIDSGAGSGTGYLFSLESYNASIDPFRVIANSGYALNVDQSGNVGIGTSATGGRLIVGDGNVGIGWTTPLATLAVSGNLGIGPTSARSRLAAGTYLATDGNIGVGTTTANNAFTVIGAASIGGAYNFAAPTNGLVVQGNVGIGISAPSQLLQVGSGTNTLAFTSGGNLGVGITTPAFPLHVIGNVGIGSSLTTTGLGVFNGGLQVSGLSNLTGNVGIGTSLNVTSASILDSLQVTKSISGATLGISGISTLSGNVGIGSSLTVTSQGIFSSGLTVAAHTQLNGSFTLGDNGDLGSINTSDWDISSTGDLTGIGAITADGTFTFSGVALDITTASNQDLTIIPSGTGNVGIGTSNIGGRLVVLGQAGVGTGNVGIGFTTPTANLHILNTGTNNSLRIDDVLEDTTPLIVDASGNLGIGATTAAYALDVWGTGRFTSTLTVGGNVGVGSSITGFGALNGLNVTGLTNLAGLNATGNVGIGQSLTVTSAGVFNSSLLASGLVLANGGLTLETGDTLTINGDAFTDLTGSGLAVSSNALQISLYTTVADGSTTSSVSGLELVSGGLSLLRGCAEGGVLKWNNTAFTWDCGIDAGGGGGGAGGWIQYTAQATVGLSTISENVGIGTSQSVANAKLQVQGNANGTGLAFYTVNNANSVFGLVAQDDGNVGIGTTDPNASLQVQGNVGIGWSGNTSPAAFPALGLSVFGNVGIGTTSPNFPLHVTGNVGIGGTLNLTSSSYASCTALKTDSSGRVTCGGAADAVTPNVYTANDTWTRPANTRFVQVIVTAGGGGGGGADNTNGTTSEAAGGGGGSGGTTIEMMTPATSTGSQTVTVGGGGTAGADTGGTGGTGNTSSFGSLLSANGGVGGEGTPTVGTAVCTNQVGAGGAGGAATTDGDVNLAGGAGGPGSCGGDDAVLGGAGGASYWGGGGKGATDPTADGSNAGSNGVAYGSGGGGAAAEDTATGAAGGVGAGGVVVVFSYTGTGGDIAEWYETKPGVELGDVVSVSKDFLEYESFATGLEKTSILEKATAGSGIVGVVSTMPFQVVGGDILGASKNAKPIALAGRVPVKVSLENGQIKAGDLLTVSAVPGVAMRATKAGYTIGRALEDASCVEGEVCKVLVLVNTSYSSGMLLKEVMREDGIDLDAIPGDLDVGRIILAQLIREKQDIVASSTVSEIFTDRLVAGLEVITPRVITQELVAETINAVTLNVDKIKANQIEGLEIWTNKIGSLSQKLAQLEATSSAQVATPSASLAETPSTPSAQPQPIQFASSVVDLTVEGLATVSGQLTAQRLHVKDSAIVEMVLNVVDTITSQRLFVTDLADFLGQVIFRKDVTFQGRATFNQDTAGLAVVRAGEAQVKVDFTKEYFEVPAVNISVNVNELADQINQEVIEQQILNGDIRYIVTRKTTKGFVIKLNKPAPLDLPFSWTALAIKKADATQSAALRE